MNRYKHGITFATLFLALMLYAQGGGGWQIHVNLYAPVTVFKAS